MRGFAFDPGVGTLTFADGARNALVAPGGTLVNLLPAEFTVTDHDAVFPDCSKGRMFTHIWASDYNSLGDEYGLSEVGRCFVTALPQEWSDTTILGDAPDDTDIFTAQVRLIRTVAPTHNWISSAINTLVPENVWIPLTGSLLLEAHLGFARAMSIYIDDDSGSPTYRKLVLHQQQSVGTAPGGYGTFGLGEPGIVPAATDTSGNGETTHNGTAGWPVYYPGDTGSPHYKARAYVEGGDVFPPATPQAYRRTGSSPPSLTDPTDYSSTWQFDLRGQFGRRS